MLQGLERLLSEAALEADDDIDIERASRPLLPRNS
jgi:hypothetical protein